MLIRERIEELEDMALSPYAIRSKNSRGRIVYEEKCEIRTDFQRDRDRIIHSKAFRRLKDKTQVFISPEGDHYRTRLTHTLEVTQIARTVARALKLNEDLTEAIAIGHDLGHTPFGHQGERILNELNPNAFTHYKQGIRVVDFLESGKGLNLTYEVRDGIANHTGQHIPMTLEGKIVKYADKIAYLSHDIDDAERANIIKKEDIPKRFTDIIGNRSPNRINSFVMDLIKNSYETADVHMSDYMTETLMGLREFMFTSVYHSHGKSEIELLKVKFVIGGLYQFYIDNPDELPDDYKHLLNEHDLCDVVCDHIASMSDKYAINEYKKLFIPKSWI